jgi:hypothetical protein
MEYVLQYSTSTSLLMGLMWSSPMSMVAWQLEGCEGVLSLTGCGHRPEWLVGYALGKLLLVSVKPVEWELEGSTCSCSEADTAVPEIPLCIGRTGCGHPTYCVGSAMGSRGYEVAIHGKSSSLNRYHHITTFVSVAFLRKELQTNILRVDEMPTAHRSSRNRLHTGPQSKTRRRPLEALSS